MSTKRLGAVIVIIVVSAVVRASPAFALCDELLNRFNSAIAERNLPDVKDLEPRIIADASCTVTTHEVQEQRARLELILARQIIDRPGPVSEAEELIVDADKPEVLWRAAVGLAQIRFSQRRFGDATRLYERALQIMRDRSKTPIDPGDSTLRAVADLSAESRILAAAEESGPSPASDQTSCNCFGLKKIPIPIRFETASSKFTPVGEQAAKELVEMLKEQAPPEITLVGHADQRGGSQYNMSLSEKRAKAVADFLRKNGIQAQIITIAKGKSEPLQLDSISELTKADILALNRRVVWKRD